MENTTIKIGSKEYEIIYKTPIIVKGVSVWGYVDVPNCQILIDSGLCEQTKFNSLIHEVIHAVLYEIGSELFNNEPFVESLSNMLAQVMLDNRDMYE